MNLSFSPFFVYPLLALFVATAAMIVLGLFGLSRTARRSRSWQGGLVGCFVVALIQVLLILNSREIAETYNDAELRFYTDHLSSPRVLRGIRFPAGSTVRLDPDGDHSVLGGTVPAPTLVLGARIIGDFTVSQIRGDLVGAQSADRPVAYLSEGTLVEPMTVRDIACAAGKFSHTFDDGHESFNCTLAADYRVDDIAVPAGSNVAVDIDPYSKDVDVGGNVPHDWSARGIACAKGHFQFRPGLTCSLRASQNVAGYALAGGQEVTLAQDKQGQRWLYSGILAEDLVIDGVRVPAGSVISTRGGGTAIVDAHVLSSGADDQQLVRFALPKGSRLTLGKAEVKGDQINLECYPGQIRVLIDDGPPGNESFRIGDFDTRTRTLQWEKV